MNIYDMLATDKQTLKTLQTDIDNQYLSYPIAKKKGKAIRWIDAPQPELKTFQEAFLNSFLYKFTVHPCCVGFVRGKNVASGAKQHLGSKQLLNMDFQNFFGAIHIGKVRQLVKFLFSRYKKITDNVFTFTSYDVELFAALLTFKSRLPQGAPTSPAISNLCTLPLDKELAALAAQSDCIYTRYADDLSFSTKQEKAVFDVKDLIKPVSKKITRAQLTVNYKKTRVQRPHNRMTVTGVVVNEKLSTPKWYWRNFRAKLHNLQMSQVPVTPEEYQEIRGTAEWIKMLHPIRGQQFLNTIGKLNLML
ncbi:MAG: RNA-directed DNA polymerase [Rhodobacteraceae bacterium]|nr:RNA-directed DNA polymerase [Paracoccaceae bacterium]